ncbi:MAG: hypothetical protein ACJAUG_000482 [Halioglobus sp.]|jgi:hypothetical protein
MAQYLTGLATLNGQAALVGLLPPPRIVVTQWWFDTAG